MKRNYGVTTYHGLLHHDTRNGNKRFSVKYFTLVPMSTVISTFPHRSMVSSAHQGKKKDLQTYNFKRICEAFILYPVPHTTRMIEAAQNSLPLEGPGTRLANPSVHSDLSISEGKWRFYIYHGRACYT